MNQTQQRLKAINDIRPYIKNHNGMFLSMLQQSMLTSYATPEHIARVKARWLTVDADDQFTLIMVIPDVLSELGLY